MKIKIRLKKDMKIQQPMTNKSWEFGHFVASVQAGQNNSPYAVVITEYGEFELVSFYAMEEAKE